MGGIAGSLGLAHWNYAFCVQQPRKAMLKKTIQHGQHDDGLAKTVVSGIAGSPSLARPIRAVYAQQTRIAVLGDLLEIYTNIYKYIWVMIIPHPKIDNSTPSASTPWFTAP